MERRIMKWVILILISVAFGENAIPFPQDMIFESVTNITTVDQGNLRHEKEYTRLQTRLDRGSQTWDGNHPRYRLLTALYGFSRYKERHIAEVNRWRSLYKNVSKKQRVIIESAVKYSHKLNTVDHLIDVNDRLAQKIVQTGLEFYKVPRSELDAFIAEQAREGKSADRTSITQAMKHYVRDWAEEGGDERNEAFSCILHQLSQMDRKGKAPLKTLVPGGGVGRLAHTIAGLEGFEVTMNEWSMYMNLVYRQLTHEPIIPNGQSFHPWLDWWSHHATTADMQRAVPFPETEVDVSAVLLVEGDFTTVFNGEDELYDVVVTLFFIDTARNLLSYLETIHRLLRPGGVWLNLGPLLYGTAPFLQLSLDEITALVEAVGFRLEDTDEACGDLSLEGLTVRGKEVSYARNPRGLSKNAYLAQSWRAVKI